MKLKYLEGSLDHRGQPIARDRVKKQPEDQNAHDDGVQERPRR